MTHGVQLQPNSDQEGVTKRLTSCSEMVDDIAKVTGETNNGRHILSGLWMTMMLKKIIPSKAATIQSHSLRIQIMLLFKK